MLLHFLGTIGARFWEARPTQPSHPNKYTPMYFVRCNLKFLNASAGVTQGCAASAWCLSSLCRLRSAGELGWNVGNVHESGQPFARAVHIFGYDGWLVSALTFFICVQVFGWMDVLPAVYIQVESAACSQRWVERRARGGGMCYMVRRAWRDAQDLLSKRT